MVSKVYMICTAYESGIGHGLKLDGVSNPYAAHTDEREAWQTGYDEGANRAKRADLRCIECGQPTMHMGDLCFGCGKSRKAST